jgi:hypothetical protein
MAVTREFVVKLLADSKGLISDFQAVRGETEKTFGVANEKLLKMMPTFKLMTTAAAGVFGGLVAGAGLAVKAAAENESAQNRLRQILLTTGKATSEQVDALNAQADALEQVGVVAGGNITVLQSQLATFDLQAATIEKLTPAIVDYVVAEKGASATAEDFKSATNGLAQALNGQFGALTRVGFTLDDVTKDLISNGTEAERAAALVGVLNSTYGGFNASLRNTTEGQLQAFRNSLGKLQEDLGKILLPLFSTFAQVLASVANVLAQNSTTVGIFLGALGLLSAAILALAGYLKIAAFQKRLMNDEFLKGILTMKNAEGQMTKLGVAVQSLGKGFAVLAAAQGIFTVLNEVTNASGKVEDAVKRTTVAINQFRKAGEEDPKAVVEQFAAAARAIQDQFRLKDVIQEFGRDFQFVMDGNKVTIEAADEAFRAFLDQDPQKAAAIVTALEKQLAVTDPTSRAYQDLKDAIDRYRGAVNLTIASQETLNENLNKTSFFSFKNTGALADIKVAHNNEARARLASADAIDKWNSNIDKLTKKSGAAKSAIDVLREAKEKVKSATQSLADAQIRERNSQESLTDATKRMQLADEGVTQAKERLAQAIRGYGKDSREGVLATRALASAQRDVQRANTAVSDALSRVTEAEKRLADLRALKADPEKVTDAEFGLEKSKLNVEEATLRVSEAEKELAETLKDPEASPIEKRRAELALAAAKFGLRDAIRDVGESERELIAVRATGATAEQLAEAERDLQDAKTAVQDAIDRQTLAVEKLNEQNEEYRKIVEGIRETDAEYVKLSADIVKAEEDQASAARSLRDQREAAAKATDALREAEEQLRLSRKEQRVAASGVPGRAFGGPVIGGRPYMVGERGPELFVPSSTGTIIPNNRVGGGGVVVNVTVNAGMGTSGSQVGQEIVDVLRQYTRVSGPLSQYVAV